MYCVYTCPKLRIVSGRRYRILRLKEVQYALGSLGAILIEDAAVESRTMASV